MFGLAGWVMAVVGGLVLGSLVLGGLASRPAYADADNKPNACGCYRDSSGSCFCGKKGKCACPGECEPKGCEEKRAKELDREIAAETKKATAGHVVKEKASLPKDDDAGAKVDKKADKAAHMTPAKKKELLRLLDAYLVEHPDRSNQTISDVQRSLGSN